VSTAATPPACATPSQDDDDNVAADDDDDDDAGATGEFAVSHYTAIQLSSNLFTKFYTVQN